MTDTDRAKRAAAEAALDHVEPGMKLGLGTGSTAAHFVRALGERGGDWGLDCVATSRATAALAQEAGLRVVTLNDASWLDLTVDGADEIDPELRLIKGGGGALLVEKIVAAASDEMIVIADDAKFVNDLGAFKLPVEVVRTGWDVTRALIEEALADFDVKGRRGTLRRSVDNVPFVSDEGHLILDFDLKRIGDPDEIAETLLSIPGVVETGLFIDLATKVILGAADGSTRVLEADDD